MRFSFRVGPRLRRATAGIVAVAMVFGIVVSWDSPWDPVPGVRLHAGAAWVASNAIGQLTLLDGASAEVAAGVPLGRSGGALHTAQRGGTGYALDSGRGLVFRIDGATLTFARKRSPVATGHDGLAVFPTPHAFLILDTRRGLLATADPTTLEPRGRPHPLDVETSPEDVVTDPAGRLWMLDNRTGDLVWFADGRRHSRARAATPGASRLAVTDGRPALLDPARRRIQLLDPATGAVTKSVKVDVRADDDVAVSGSPERRRLLISVGSRGRFLSCDLDSGSCSPPVALGDGPMELGRAVEVGDRAFVPDYATGGVSVVDLATSRVVARPRLFDRPVRFDLLTRDGVVFYNDPDSDQAGVIDPDGRGRPISKYRRGELNPKAPGTDVVGEPDDEPPLDAGPDPRSENTVSIAVRPRDHGAVGDEFEFTAVAGGDSGVTSAHWTFGDRTRATGLTVRHRWDRPGTYTVNLSALLRDGEVVTAATRVVVENPNAPPHIVRVDVAPDTPQVGRPVRFSADLTGRPPQRTEWTVTGDRGTETTSHEPRFEHVFDTPGTYTVTLEVGAGAASDAQSKRFTVVPASREVNCGDTIATDAVVTRDLVCPGVALTIAAGDVVLDLGGHTISTDQPRDDRKGIVIGAGRTIRNITVRNGTVSRYPTGIEMTDVQDVTVETVTVSAGTADATPPAVVGEHAEEVRLRGVSVRAYNPFTFDHGSKVVITGSIISGDTGRGVANCGYGSSCSIEGGAIRLYGLGCYSGDLDGFSSSVSITGSDDLSIAYLGPYCDSVTVRDNERVTLLADASARQTYLTGNTMIGREALGLWNSFEVTGNSFSGSETRGIIIFSGDGVVSGNRFAGNGGYGLLVSPIPGDEPLGPLEIVDNVFEGNGFGGDEGAGFDGLRVESAGPGSDITVARNHARNNFRYGINADPGAVTDGGGNTSSGGPENCLGVVCAPG
ncbi:PKD domain-containing protein [Actinophytocola oryzae]|uniref:PKD domain-containing protein n=1 Tax=Actinophytocola oryzae TaxID=502181 RepID=A0A4R7V3A7_9PSEU|nr:PKD domain-containing protein [Actinophytocola oryzae]TDV43164.1 PKD domain-containing protein [Actinophytocola oryzae]